MTPRSGQPSRLRPVAAASTSQQFVLVGGSPPTLAIVTFEESIMSILPSACFLLLVLVQLTRLFTRKSVVVKPSRLFTAKVIAVTLYVSLRPVVIALWATSSYPTTRISVASSTLELCAALALLIISPLAHRKSPRPSFIIEPYLVVTVLLDAVRARTAWLVGDIDAVAAALTASITVKVILLTLEATSKRHMLVHTHRHLSPEATSGFFGRGFFMWLISLLRDGSRRILSISDLFPINEKLASDKLADELSVEWNRFSTRNLDVLTPLVAGNQQRKHSLAMATILTWRLEVLKITVSRLLLVAFRLMQPFIIEWVVQNISGPNTQETRNRGFGLVGAVALVYFAIAVSTGSYQHLVYRLMAMTRGGLIALIYRKLTESPIQGSDATDSAIMTLIGTDVERICESWYLLVAEVGPSVVQLGAAVWLLQRQLGAVCVAPVILALGPENARKCKSKTSKVTTALSLKAATYVAARQRIWLEAIQDRVNFTANILSNIKIMKMLGMSEALQDLIQGMRVRELTLSKRFRRLSSFNVCLTNLPFIICQMITFAAFTVVAQFQGGEPLSLSQAISSLSIITLLTSPLGMLLFAVPQSCAALGCFERIQTFLLSDSWVDNRQPYQTFPAQTRHANGDIELVLTSPLKDASAVSDEVDPDFDRIVVQKASFGWQDAQPVVRDATLRVTQSTQLILVLGPVGCGKSTFLQGILGETLVLAGSVWVRTKVIAFCDQSPWISNGTIRSCIVGSCDFDNTWYNTVIHACALDVDMQQLHHGDGTLVGSKGVSLSGGQKQRIAIARAVYSRKQIAIFDDVLSGLDAITRDAVLARVFGPSGLLRKMGTTTILATHFVDRLDMADHIVFLDERGTIAKQGPPVPLCPFDGPMSDMFGSQPSHTTQRSETRAQPSQPSSEQVPQPCHHEDEGAPAQQDRQIGDMAVYKYYFASLGWLSFLVFGLFVALNGAFGSMQDAWLTLWSQSNDNSEDPRTGYWLGLYALFAGIRVVTLITAVYYIYVVIVPRSAQNLHLIVLQTAMRAPMSFISRTDTGALINRFSQDMQLVDMTLPGALVNTSFRLAGCMGVAALSIVALPYFAAVIPVIAGVLYLLQQFYLRTSRQLRLLELESKAPLYSHILETIDGMASIRAFGWGTGYIDKSLRLIDTCQKPYYLLLCVQRWLTVVLGLIVAVLATLLTALPLALRASNINAGFVGIALVNMMGFGESLAGLITVWTELETSLGAVSRVKTFAEDTPQEPDEGEKPPTGWPAEGSLTFDNWSASYSNSPVLHGINLSILPGQTVAVCGRTGSGKSSLIASVLGMVNGSGGRIILDGVDLSLFPGNIIRNKVTVVTQDPFMFSGSVRLNLDPLKESTDNEMRAALEKVGLWTTLQGTAGSDEPPTQRALDLETDDLHLSQGQAQLFCLARAMLRRSPVIMLDEPTSSVDATTESQILEIVQTEFGRSTVIMVTHRLSGIRAFDTVAVLDHGALVEYGPPGELLAIPDSALAKLCETRADGE
ncbi:ABC transporter [Tolypocladium paradoxum]|uniref:ABC transporter n=1 Tax=Tolypocladium paradoxum TaxID=94208 RepID=A0A2S4LAS5_9HYPO|nr:ABC transporter [Tolypocladium paradoxum]